MDIEIPSELIRRLQKAEHVVVLTGAGVSAESGIPTFQEARTGVWAAYDPAELATPQAFLRNPRLVWDWYAERRQEMEAAQPGPSHYALVDLEQGIPHFLLITQNIDGLHWRAGSRELLELHGNIGRCRCFDCGTYAFGWDEEGAKPPSCAHCGGLLRPDVVWFGEGLPGQQLRAAYRATEQAHLFFSVGTSAGVQPAASLPLIARRSGAYVVEINPHETALSLMADCWLRATPGAVLPVLARWVMPQTEEEDA
ncbi:MAG: NAD-dependent deacylase [Chloroflexaceae bacterium]|nr:NAD-dependent deacylase [Chloroflexaceae bacterium]